VDPGAGLKIMEKREICCPYRDSKSLDLQPDTCLEKLKKTTKTVGQGLLCFDWEYSGETGACHILRRLTVQFAMQAAVRDHNVSWRPSSGDYSYEVLNVFEARKYNLQYRKQ